MPSCLTCYPWYDYFGKVNCRIEKVELLYTRPGIHSLLKEIAEGTLKSMLARVAK
jgi:hypothetical protein